MVASGIVVQDIRVSQRRIQNSGKLNSPEMSLVISWLTERSSGRGGKSCGFGNMNCYVGMSRTFCDEFRSWDYQSRDHEECVSLLVFREPHEHRLAMILKERKMLVGQSAKSIAFVNAKLIQRNPIKL